MKLLSRLIFILILAIVLVIGWLPYVLGWPSKPVSQTRLFAVDHGDGAVTIGRKLQQQGFIRSSTGFELYIWFIKADKDFLPGLYQLSPGLSVPSIAGLLLADQIANPSITLVEGWDRNDISAYLVKQGFSGSDYVQLTSSNKKWRDDYLLTVSIPDANSLEGFLFPDTYQVDQQSTAQTIINQQLENFTAKITPQMLADIKLQEKSLYQIIIMASIIEKEVTKGADRKVIADIFWKRIKADIGLQSDATVNFITNKGTTSASASDIQINSPYNTYKYKGLPPGPISNPGLESIMAAIYPTPNPYYYFLTDKNGGVHYAATLEEHKKNRELYLGK